MWNTFWTKWAINFWNNIYFIRLNLWHVLHFQYRTYFQILPLILNWDIFARVTILDQKTWKIFQAITTNSTANHFGSKALWSHKWFRKTVQVYQSTLYKQRRLAIHNTIIEMPRQYLVNLGSRLPKLQCLVDASFNPRSMVLSRWWHHGVISRWLQYIINSILDATPPQGWFVYIQEGIWWEELRKPLARIASSIRITDPRKSLLKMPL